MSPHRDPLSSLSTNTPLPRAGPSTKKTSLAPIFVKPLSSPPSHAPSSSPTSRILSSSLDPNIQTPIHHDHHHHSIGPRKRARLSPITLSSASDSSMDIDSEVEDEPSRRNLRVSSINKYFANTPTKCHLYRYDRVKEVGPVVPVPVVEEKVRGGSWTRRRGRLGICGSRGRDLSCMALERAVGAQPPYLETLFSSLAPYHPLIPPSILLLPSVHSPTGRPRDFSPGLSLAFNSIAKNWDASSARGQSLRRLIAIAGEEGGVRIVDVDEGLGVHREEKGFWWRAHSNAVFDIKWSGDDRRILTASGDQTTRLHALTTPTPTLLATLRGHTSSIKTTVFFDPSRSHSDPSVSSSIIASAGRDGNILIYDLRCQGRRFRDGSEGSEGGSATRRSSRERYSAGVPGFTAQQTGEDLDPVMVVRSAHGDGSRRASWIRTATRSVTSLVALQSMPGYLASGGSHDGIVKLWDLRFPSPTSRSPDPRPTCTSTNQLPDPTVASNPNRRARSINAMVESPTTGDLYVLAGDSKIHTLRPSAAAGSREDDTETIQPKTYTDPNLLVSSFYIRLAISPDGRYLSSGSGKGGVMTWDTAGKADGDGQVGATRLGMGLGGIDWPKGKEREVSAVDWGKDLLAACADDFATRIYRPDRETREWVKKEPGKAKEEWCGAL